MTDKGHHTFMLVFDAENFAGPVGYTLEEYWVDNKGDPSGPDFSHTGVKMGSTGFEFNGVQAHYSQQDSKRILKIPGLAFPTIDGKTEILAGVRSWNTKGLKEPLEAALEESAPSLNLTHVMRLNLGSQPSCDTGYSKPVQLGFAGFPLLNLGGDLKYTLTDNECVSVIVWGQEAVCTGGISGDTCRISEYWNETTLKPTLPECAPGDTSTKVTNAPCACGQESCATPQMTCNSASSKCEYGTIDWSTIDCAQECKAASFCCNDHTKSSNQKLSCAQACMIRKRGATAESCLTNCGDLLGCTSKTIGGHNYKICESCNDITSDPKCLYGVGSVEACQHGCSIGSSSTSPAPAMPAEKVLLPTSVDKLPSWSTLAQKKFPEKLFSHAPKLNILDSLEECQKSPGPAASDLHCVHTIGDTWIGYRWYKFVDQPSLQRSGLSQAQKEYLQARVERLHKLLASDTPLNNWMEAPAEAKRIGLATLDPALLLKPPAGFEHGYVPIVLYEGEHKPDSFGYTCGVGTSTTTTTTTTTTNVVQGLMFFLGPAPLPIKVKGLMLGDPGSPPGLPPPQPKKTHPFYLQKH